MKKSILAVAVAGAVGAPMSAAQAAEAYGFINVGVESISSDNGGLPSLLFTGGNDGSVHLADTAESRFGFKGSEDLGNGLTAGYRFEIGMGTDAFENNGAGFCTGTDGCRFGGSVVEDTVPSLRLANVSLSGDFGSVKFGTQWGVLYEYLGWNAFRGTHGYATWYTNTQPLAHDTSGLRVDSAITYTYGAGGYGSDPFSFSVQGVLEEDTGTGANENDETLDAVGLAAKGVFGDIEVVGVNWTESNAASGASEPSVTGVGVGWNANSDLRVAGDFIVTDLDAGNNDDLETLQVTASYNLGGGNSVAASIGETDTGNNNADVSSLFLGFYHSMSSRTTLWVELEDAARDAAGGDQEATLLSANIKHSF